MANDPFIKTDLNYSEIKWYRKRWALVLSALFFMPAAIVVAATGDIYAQRKDGVYQYGEQQKKMIIGIFSFWMIFNILKLVMSSM